MEMKRACVMVVDDPAEALDVLGFLARPPTPTMLAGMLVHDKLLVRS
jgi:hypothetical protein